MKRYFIIVLILLLGILSLQAQWGAETRGHYEAQASLEEANNNKVEALEKARYRAIRKAAEFVGVEVESETKIKDFEMEYDNILITCKGVVKDIKEIYADFNRGDTTTVLVIIEATVVEGGLSLRRTSAEDFGITFFTKNEWSESFSEESDLKGYRYKVDVKNKVTIFLKFAGSNIPTIQKTKRYYPFSTVNIVKKTPLTLYAINKNISGNMICYDIVRKFDKLALHLKVFELEYGGCVYYAIFECRNDQKLINKYYPMFEQVLASFQLEE